MPTNFDDAQIQIRFDFSEAEKEAERRRDEEARANEAVARQGSRRAPRRPRAAPSEGGNKAAAATVAAAGAGRRFLSTGVGRAAAGIGIGFGINRLLPFLEQFIRSDDPDASLPGSPIDATRNKIADQILALEKRIDKLANELSALFSALSGTAGVARLQTTLDGAPDFKQLGQFFADLQELRFRAGFLESRRKRTDDRIMAKVIEEGVSQGSKKLYNSFMGGANK